MTDAINLYAVLTQIDAGLINGKTFNFGFENHKVIEIARIIQQQLEDLNVEIQVTDTHDHRDYHISSGKIQRVLGYTPVSSIGEEVRQLRAALEAGHFANIDAPEYYNMKVMELGRHNGSYAFLSRE
jgi:nucleoside-diphosphate-sugar epimerase